MSGFYADPFDDPFGPPSSVPTPPAQGPQPFQQPAFQAPASFAPVAPKVGPSMTPTPVGGADMWQPQGFQQQHQMPWGSPQPQPSPQSHAQPVGGWSPAPQAPVQSPATVTAVDDDFGISWDFGGPDKKAPATAGSKSAAPPAPQPARSPATPQPKPSSPQASQVTRSPQPQGKAADENPQGVCLARVSTRSIFVREWKPCFWVIVNHRLWIYRSKADYNPMDYLHDPFSERIKKSFHLRDSMRVSDIKGKVYPGESRTLYTFGIDYIEEDGGKELMAKFAAYDYDQVRQLREELDKRIFEERVAGKKK